LLFQKAARSITGINIVAVVAGFVNPSSYIRRKNCRKNAGAVQSFASRGSLSHTPMKKKKPGIAGPL
jgi:hypothetical protein